MEDDFPNPAVDFSASATGLDHLPLDVCESFIWPRVHSGACMSASCQASQFGYSGLCHCDIRTLLRLCSSSRRYAKAAILEESWQPDEVIEVGGESLIVWWIKQPNNNPAWNDNFILRTAVRLGFAECVQTLLHHPTIQPTFDNYIILRMAASCDALVVGGVYMIEEKEHPPHRLCRLKDDSSLNIMKMLLEDERLAPSKVGSIALLDAIHSHQCSASHAEMVSVLLQYCDPTVKANTAIARAARVGRIEVMKQLLAFPEVDPSANSNAALRQASEKGHHAAVQLLLQDKRVRPDDKNNEALRLACRNGHSEVVRVLLRDCRVDPTVQNGYAKKIALKNGYTDILEQLSQRKDPMNGDPNQPHPTLSPTPSSTAWGPQILF